MRKPKFIAVQCPWCQGAHWLVKPNILTSRALAAVAAFATQAEADAEAERLSSLFLQKSSREVAI